MAVRRSTSTKHVFVLALGTFIVLLGAIVSAVGAFRSVMHDPRSMGPYRSTDTAQSSRINFRHYVALISYFPEIFDCRQVKTIYENTLSDQELFIGDNNIRQAASYYCWRESGDAVWLYTFGFVILFVFIILGFIAAFRSSGQQAALSGVGFSAVILLWALLTIVHYQEHNNIPRALNAFGNCKNFAAIQVSRAAYAPWTPSNAFVTSDFGLETYPFWNPVSDISGNRLARAFYYTRRGGSDTFDESATYACSGSACTALPTPQYPNVLSTVNVDGNVVAGVNNALPTVNGNNVIIPSNTGSSIIPNAVATPVEIQLITTSHGRTDQDASGSSWWNIDFNRSPARIFGPTPRRSWLCADDWTYDGTLRVSANLVYGGLATVALGAIITLTAFGYLAVPIIGIVKFPSADIQGQRASNLAEDLSEESYGDNTDF